MTALDIDLLENLKLEVEKPPVGLANLVANPSGELGGWGWVTPVGGSAIAGTGTRLRHTAPTPAAATNFYTESAAVAAGQYVAASWIASAMSGGYYRVKIEYLNAAGAVIASSAQTAYLQASGTAVSAGPFLAPALTAYARLRFDVYSTNAGANPLAAAWLEMYQVTMAKAATSGALGTVRTNLLTNPSHEANPLAGWTSDNGASTVVARSVAQAYVGAASTSFKAATNGATAAVRGGLVGVTAGREYAFTFALRGTAASFFGVTIEWRSGGGGSTLISSTTTPPFSPAWQIAANVWGFKSLSGVAPPGATLARVVVWVPSALAANTYYLDASIFEEDTGAVYPVTYFSGATANADGWTYAWTSTADASSSTATTTNLPYIEPVIYQDILGGSCAISLNRLALDVGVLAATIKDASLDPATASLIRPGRKVRARVLNNATGLWDVLVAAVLDKGKVSYDLRKPLAKQATITMATVDANQVLANTNRPDGVATISALPYVLEGARIPWNVNGSGNQVAAATVASKNESASALDQVVLARDSDLGYAWVTKEGVLTAYTDRTLDYYGTGTPLLDESVYSGLDVTFDADDCVNEVLVTFKRYTANTGNVEEVVFGPYRDAASIAEWGVHQATFTVHGIAEAAIPAYAASILAANAQPARRINSVSIPIRTTADLIRTRALIDLYAKVRVTNTDKALDQTLRVTRIQHDITPRRWNLVLGFDQVSTVAKPIPTTPQGGLDSGGWVNMAGLTGMTVTFAQCHRDGNRVHVRGNVSINAIVAVTLNGGITDQALVQVPAGMWPGDGAKGHHFLTFWVNSNRIGHGYVSYADGKIRLQAVDGWSAVSNLPANCTVQFSTSYDVG